MYERYLADPTAVDAAWHDFFADYRPAAGPAGSVRQAPADSHDHYDDDDSEAAAPATTASNGHDGGRPTAGSHRDPAADIRDQGAVDGRDQASSGTTETSAAVSVAQNPAPTPPSIEQPAAAQPTAAKPAAEQPAAAKPAAAQPTAAQPTAAKPAAPPTAKPSWTSPSVAPTAAAEAHATVLRGAPAKVVTNMQASLEIPTATSVRAVPAKLLADNRIIINNHLRRARGGKVSFTHLIGYAIVRALHDYPEMNNFFALNTDGKPVLVQPEHVNLGLAIDLPGKDGGRSLVVASIKVAEKMDFAAFWGAYEDIIRRARGGKLTADDFAGATVSLTNPGTIGTNHSVPRLMQGQGAIIGVGAMDYPAEFSGMNPDALNDMGISRTMTLTSTYDHRIIQGAQSGEFLRRVHQLLLGEDSFYYDIFAALRIPYEPAIWLTDREF
ncbi:MAG: 2-oxo acid dehydrogenase subunit E2, partial [Jatrophihabitantaceae bacterium]